MPTSYTEPVSTGEVTDLRTFALRCARNFGALATMRHAPLSAPLPDEIKPEDLFSPHWLEDNRRELARLKTISPSEAQRECQQAHTRELARWRQERDRIGMMRARYKAMMLAVAGWYPPTLDHIELKNFMLDQLRESLMHDCPEDGYPRHPGQIKPWPVWLHDRKKLLTYKIQSDQRNWARITALAKDKTMWLRELRFSLE